MPSKPVIRRKLDGGFDSRPPPLCLTCGLGCFVLGRMDGDCTGLNSGGVAYRTIGNYMAYLRIRSLPGRSRSLGTE